MGQAFDDKGTVLGSESGLNEEEVLKKLKENVKKTGLKATHFTIGKMPKKDQVIEIRGLMYKVTYVDGALGKLFLKLI